MKKDNGPHYALKRKLNWVYTSSFKRLYTAFLNSIKLSGCRMGVNIYEGPSAVEQNKQATKIVNACIVHDLDALPNSPLHKFRLELCLFHASYMVKHNDRKIWFIVVME